MPQVFKIGNYLVYFWVNENDPLEPFMYMFPKDYHLIMAASMVSLIPVSVVFLCLQRYFIEGIATSGLKG